MKKEFETWYTNLKDSREINSSISMEEIAEWIEQAIIKTQIQTENSIYHFLRSKVVVLQGDLPMVHSEYLNDIKTKVIDCHKHRIQFIDKITKRCPHCETKQINKII